MDYAFAEEIKDELWQLYLTGGRQAVAARLGIRYNSTGHVLKRLGFYKKLELRNEAVRKRVKNRNPFIYENSIKYYLLGFILGDGSLVTRNNGTNLSLRIEVKDRQIMEDISKQFELPIKETTCGCWRMDSYDYSTVKTLLDIGMHPNKSKEGNPPIKVPEEFKEAFICGLLDSDGSILYKNHGRQLSLALYGHESYMPWVQTLIPSSLIRKRKDGLVEVSLNRQSDVIPYLKMMYEKSPLHLNRKYERFIKHIENRSNPGARIDG